MVVLILGDGIAQVDQELRETSLSCCIVAEDCGESGVSERLRQALTEGLSGSVVVAKPRCEGLARAKGREGREKMHTSGSIGPRA